MKCHQYFPESADQPTISFPDEGFEVSFVSSDENNEHFKLRILTLKKTSVIAVLRGSEPV